MRYSKLLSLLAVFVVSGVSRAEETIEYEVHNLSNDPVAVAHAFNNGKTVSIGWARINPNEKQSFKADFKSGLCLRIEQNGSEITFPNFQQFLQFPITAERFTVEHTDNPQVDNLRWGPDLENGLFHLKTNRLPDGWGVARYFHANAAGKHRLEVVPPKE